jgi:hypothetical protein
MEQNNWRNRLVMDRRGGAAGRDTDQRVDGLIRTPDCSRTRQRGGKGTHRPRLARPLAEKRSVRRSWSSARGTLRPTGHVGTCLDEAADELIKEVQARRRPNRPSSLQQPASCLHQLHLRARRIEDSAVPPAMETP